jgi:hypothetical protein
VSSHITAILLKFGWQIVKVAGTSSVNCSSVKMKQYCDVINISVEYKDLQEYVVPKMQINLSTFSGLRGFFFWWWGGGT